MCLVLSPPSHPDVIYLGHIASSAEEDFGTPIAFETLGSASKAVFEPRVGVRVHLGPDYCEAKRSGSRGHGQTPQSFTPSRMLVRTRRRTSFRRKRDSSPSYVARNVRPVVAGSDGDSLPHHLTAGPAVSELSPRIQCGCSSLKAGNLFTVNQRRVTYVSVN